MNEAKKYSEFQTNSFTHNWLPRRNLKRIDTPEGRRYLVENSCLYPSVTTVLSSVENEEIENWRNAVGKEEADRVSKRATTRGTLLHENIESYLLNTTVRFDKTNFIAVNNFKRMIPILSRINNIRLLEAPLFSHNLKMAGTIDCCAEFDNELAVIDFKTSSRKKEQYEIDSYFIQTSIYSLMIEELYGIKINNLVILMSVDNEQPIVFTDTRKKWFKEIVNYVSIAKSLINKTIMITG